MTSINNETEVEPFDFSLQEQVRKLYQDVENETTHLTKLRRETPQQLKRTYEESFNKSLQELSSLQKEIEQLEEEDDDMEDKFKKLKPKLDEMTVQYSQSIHQIKEIRDVCTVHYTPSCKTGNLALTPLNRTSQESAENLTSWSRSPSSSWRRSNAPTTFHLTTKHHL